MMYWPDHGMSGWALALAGLTTLLFWVMLIAAVVVLVRYLSRGTGSSGRGSAERILAERYARGEIDEQEYRQRLGVLRGGGAG
jgi:putative membrane protein